MSYKHLGFTSKKAQFLLFANQMHFDTEPNSPGFPISLFNTHLVNWMRTIVAHRPFSPHTLAAPISAKTSRHSRTLSHVSNFCWESGYTGKGKQICEMTQYDELQYTVKP